jgi:hypothetical protein
MLFHPISQFFNQYFDKLYIFQADGNYIIKLTIFDIRFDKYSSSSLQLNDFNI